MLTRFRFDRRGATAIEYALIACLVSLSVVVGASTIGSTLMTRYYGPTADALK